METGFGTLSNDTFSLEDEPAEFSNLLGVVLPHQISEGFFAVSESKMICVG